MTSSDKQGLSSHQWRVALILERTPFTGPLQISSRKNENVRMYYGTFGTGGIMGAQPR